MMLVHEILASDCESGSSNEATEVFDAENQDERRPRDGNEEDGKGRWKTEMKNERWVLDLT